MQQFFVYIIYSAKLDRYYTGYTTNIDKRLSEHNSGISTYSSTASDWIIKWNKAFDSRKEAMDEERRIKNKKAENILSG